MKSDIFSEAVEGDRLSWKEAMCDNCVVCPGDDADTCVMEVNLLTDWSDEKYVDQLLVEEDTSLLITTLIGVLVVGAVHAIVQIGDEH